MNNFCKSCFNLLSYVNESDKTIKKCAVCLETYPMEDVDTLRYQKSKKSVVIFDKTTANNAGDDPMNKKVRETCKLCKNRFMRLYRSGDMTTYLVCCGCKNVELYSKISEARTQQARVST